MMETSCCTLHGLGSTSSSGIQGRKPNLFPSCVGSVDVLMTQSLAGFLAHEGNQCLINQGVVSLLFWRIDVDVVWEYNSLASRNVQYMTDETLKYLQSNILQSSDDQGTSSEFCCNL
jgi:hypothetical protein